MGTECLTNKLIETHKRNWEYHWGTGGFSIIQFLLVLINDTNWAILTIHITVVT